MWALTPEFCKQIPHKKAPSAIITLTALEEANPNEQTMIDIVVKNYDKVYCWIQGDRDLDYFNQFNNTESIELIPPNVKAYEEILNNCDVDYIGTRLHGGVYAMRHKKRAIIIAIDERAKEINASNNLNCLMINEMDKLEAMIQSEFETKIIMPFEEITRWKSQFEEFKI